MSSHRGNVNNRHARQFLAIDITLLNILRRRNFGVMKRAGELRNQRQYRC